MSLVRLLGLLVLVWAVGGVQQQKRGAALTPDDTAAPTSPPSTGSSPPPPPPASVPATPVASVVAGSIIEATIAKSKTDKRQYRRFTLSNGLDVLVVSDPTTSKGAAAMDCGNGYFSDPEDVPGIAHFLEHMLFLGTKKYPSEDDYSSFLTTHGGADNAYTGHENTCFFFDVQPAYLEQGLDKFSQFFTAPLMSESATKREMNAINNEHSKNLNDDEWRLAQLMASLASSDTPYHKFGTGNLETLSAKPTDVVRQLLLDYYHSRYVAENLRLVVLGAEPLDELQALVCKYFGGVPRAADSAAHFAANPAKGPVPPPSEAGGVSAAAVAAQTSTDPTDPSSVIDHSAVVYRDLHTLLYHTIDPHSASRPSEGGGASSQPDAAQAQSPPITRPALVKWQTIEDSDSMVMVWSLPPQTADFRVKALDYISDLLCFSGDGGVEHALKTKGLIHGLATDVLTSTFFTEFSVRIAMTRQGLNLVDDVAHAIYAYIDLIHDQGIADWRYNETQYLSQLLFDFKDTENPYDYVSDLASRMRFYPKHQVLTAPVLFFDFSSAAISDLIAKYLVPANMLVYVGRKDWGEQSALPFTEKWYGTKFDVVSIAPGVFVEQHQLYGANNANANAGDSVGADSWPTSTDAAGSSDGTPSPDQPAPLPESQTPQDGNASANSSTLHHLPVEVHQDSNKHKTYQVTKHMIIIANSNGLDPPKEDPNALLARKQREAREAAKAAAGGGGADAPQEGDNAVEPQPPLFNSTTPVPVNDASASSSPSSLDASPQGDTQPDPTSELDPPVPAPADAPVPAPSDAPAPAPASAPTPASAPAPAAPVSSPPPFMRGPPADAVAALPTLPADQDPHAPVKIVATQPDNTVDKNKRYEVTKNMVIIANSDGTSTPNEPLNAAHADASPSAFSVDSNLGVSSVPVGVPPASHDAFKQSKDDTSAGTTVNANANVNAKTAMPSVPASVSPEVSVVMSSHSPTSLNAPNGNAANAANAANAGNVAIAAKSESLIEVASRVTRRVPHDQAYHGDAIRRWVLPPQSAHAHPAPLSRAQDLRLEQRILGSAAAAQFKQEAHAKRYAVDFSQFQLAPENPYVPRDLSIKAPFEERASQSYIASRLAPVPTSPAAILGARVAAAGATTTTATVTNALFKQLPHDVLQQTQAHAGGSSRAGASKAATKTAQAVTRHVNTNANANAAHDDTALTVAVDLDSIPLSDVSSQWGSQSVSLAVGTRACVTSNGAVAGPNVHLEPEVVAAFVCDDRSASNSRFSDHADRASKAQATAGNTSPAVSFTAPLADEAGLTSVAATTLGSAGDPVPVRVYTTTRAAKRDADDVEEKQKLAEANESPFTYPVLINETTSPYHFRVWFKQDVEFRLPRVILTARLWTPTVYESAKSEVLTSLYVSLVGEVLDSIDSLAAHAGYLYSITSGRSYIDLTIRGFDGGIRNYVHDVVSRMVAPAFAPTAMQFEQAVAELGQDYRNDQFQSPRDYAAYIAALALRSPQHTTPQLLRALNTVSLGDVMTFARDLYADVALEALLFGNLYPEDAVSLVGELSKILDFSTSSPAWNNLHRTVRLGRSAVGAGYRLSQLNAHYTVQTTMPNDEETNSAIYNYYQLPLGNRIDVMYASLLALIAERPCYAQLRTREQLAYIVWSEDDTQLAVPAFSVRIQSGTHSAKYLSYRVNAFLDDLRTIVVDMTDEEFITYIETLVGIKLTPATSLSQQSDRFWGEISGQGYNFRRRSHQVALLETGKINKEGLLMFFDFMFGFTPPLGGGMLSVQVDPSPAALTGDSDEDGSDEQPDPEPSDDDDKQLPAPTPATQTSTPAPTATPAPATPTPAAAALRAKQTTAATTAAAKKASHKAGKRRSSGKSRRVGSHVDLSSERAENEAVCDSLDIEVKIARGEWRHVPANFTDPESPYTFLAVSTNIDAHKPVPAQRRAASLLELSAQRTLVPPKASARPQRVSNTLLTSSATVSAPAAQKALQPSATKNPGTFHASRFTSHTLKDRTAVASSAGGSPAVVAPFSPHLRSIPSKTSAPVPAPTAAASASTVAPSSSSSAIATTTSASSSTATLSSAAHRTHVTTSETYSLYVSTLSQLSDSMSLYALPAVAPTPDVYEL